MIVGLSLRMFQNNNGLWNTAVLTLPSQRDGVDPGNANCVQTRGVIIRTGGIAWAGRHRGCILGVIMAAGLVVSETVI